VSDKKQREKRTRVQKKREQGGLPLEILTINRMGGKGVKIWLKRDSGCISPEGLRPRKN